MTNLMFTNPLDEVIFNCEADYLHQKFHLNFQILKVFSFQEIYLLYNNSCYNLFDSGMNFKENFYL